MKRVFFLGLAVLVGAGGFWLYRMLYPPDERVIRRALGQAAAAVSVRSGQGAFDKFAAVNRLLSLCDPEIEILLQAPGLTPRSIRGHDQLRETALAVLGSGETLEVQLLDVDVRISEDRSEATAQFIARARTGGSEDDLIQEFRVLLLKRESRWIMRRVEPLSSLGI